MSDIESGIILSELERKYLETGETGSYSEPELNKRIESKAEEDLPQDIIDLIQDISLLYREGILESEGGEKGRETLRKKISDSRITEKAETPTESDIQLIQAEKSSEEIHLGIEIGNILKFLYSDINKSDFDSPSPEAEYWHNLIWGIVLSFTYNYAYNAQKTYTERLDLLRELDKLGNLKLNISIEQTKGVEYLSKRSRPTLGIIKKVLSENGIHYTPLLKHRIFREVGVNFDLDPKDTDQKKEDELGEKINELISQYNLREVEKIHDYLRRDKKHIRSKYYKDTNVEELLKFIWGRKGKKRSYIAKEMKRDKKFVSQALKEISGDSDRWENRPLVKKEDKRWYTTSYGDLLIRYSGKENPHEWLHYLAILQGDKNELKKDCDDRENWEDGIQILTKVIEDLC